MREIPREAETAAFVDELASGRFGVVIFQTGVGTAALLRDAEQRGRLADVLAAVGAATLVCRGPKPTAVVRRHGLEPTLVPQKPFTTKEVLAGARRRSIWPGRDVPSCITANATRRSPTRSAHAGRRLDEACPYEWALPENVEPLRALVRDTATQLDAIVFTSQIQVRHLFTVAERDGAARCSSPRLSMPTSSSPPSDRSAPTR